MEQVKDSNRRIVITVAKKPHTGGGSTLLGRPRLQTRQVDEAEETARKMAMLESLSRLFRAQ
jgi:hypothetical protein